MGGVGGLVAPSHRIDPRGQEGFLALGAALPFAVAAGQPLRARSQHSIHIARACGQQQKIPG